IADPQKNDPTGMGFYPQWAWSWPLNRRVMYNRASADLNGKPWDAKRPGIQWDGSRWQGDVPDYPATMDPKDPAAWLPLIMNGEGDQERRPRARLEHARQARGRRARHQASRTGDARGQQEDVHDRHPDPLGLRRSVGRAESETVAVLARERAHAVRRRRRGEDAGVQGVPREHREAM